MNPVLVVGIEHIKPITTEVRGKTGLSNQKAQDIPQKYERQKK